MNALDTHALFAAGVETVFYVLAVAFSIHALVLGYHWITYGEERKVAITALALYLSGGAILLLTIATSLYFI